MKYMKKIVKVINNTIVTVILFFTYFLIIGVARIFYIISNGVAKKATLWEKKSVNTDKNYFISPY
jgi:hypothetical protein